MELPVRICRLGLVKGCFQNGNLRLIQIKGEEMWKGRGEYKPQISSVVSFVYFSIEIDWIILCKTFLEPNEKRITLSGSPWPKCDDEKYMWLALVQSFRCVSYTLWGCELFFLTINVLSFCPWSLSSPPPPGRVLILPVFEEPCPQDHRGKSAFHFSSLSPILSWCFYHWCELRRAQDEGAS